MAMQLRSSAYGYGDNIPKRYTCDGEDVSPPLDWSGVPQNTRGLVLIIDDPDAPDPAAPRMTWVHWLVFNIPPDTAGLPEGVGKLPAGTHIGVNSGGRRRYSGPCPPIGRHRYFHKLYAIDVELNNSMQDDVEAVMKAIQGHVLASTEFFATYEHGA
jgi:Raf kinase inhibitor-like YbhB/YbcL family protein